MRVTLDGKRMTTQQDTHDYLQKELQLPDYYGKNLDALWDLLSAYYESLHIVLLNAEAIEENLGDYGKKLLQLFDDAEEEILGFTIAKR